MAFEEDKKGKKEKVTPKPKKNKEDEGEGCRTKFDSSNISAKYYLGLNVALFKYQLLLQ